MSKIFIVCHGERGRGGFVVGVFEDKIKATTKALTQKTHFTEGWKQEGVDYWVNGCDFVSIEEWEVER